MAFDKAKAVRAAEKHLAQGKIAAAIQEYSRIVEHDPSDFTALNTLGDLYSRVDKKQEAVQCFRAVANHYREQGFTLKAIAMYKKVTRYTPGAPDIARALGELYEQQGLLIDARAQYLMVADALARAGQNREALEVLRRIADLDPNNIQIRLRLAESLLAEGMNDHAAEAFTVAGDRLLSRNDFEKALDAYTKALNWQPHNQMALQGLLACHTALGTADEAADVLEQAVAARPHDMELRMMLMRAQLEAENALAAEVAVQELVGREPTNYVYFFDVAQLHLQQGNMDEAVRVLTRVIEPALSGREEDKLLELLQEVLARNPEQMEALRLLVRIHTWQRDDDRLRMALESIAETAEARGLVDEERAALTQLVRLSPDEERYSTRLEAIGGAAEGEEDAAQRYGGIPARQPDASEVPTFESFMMSDDSSSVASEPTPAQAGSEFEWNTVEAPAEEPQAAADGASSFADLNDFTDATGSSYSFSQPAAAEPASADFQEVDFSFSAGASSDTETSPEGGASSATSSERVAALLTQELESVDYYLAQGYTDIARDTLDMLEGQYGTNPEIEARRAQLAAAGEPSAASAEPAPATAEAFADFSFSAEGEFAAPAATNEAPGNEFAGFTLDAGTPEAETPASAVGGAQGIDPGLAAIFDEFREAVDEADATQDGDFETHFNLGLAYKDMDLFDQAIEEFQTAAGMSAPNDGTSRYLQCCNLLGYCFMRNGEPRPASIWFRKGLDATGHTEDEYQALRFELGTAYEQMGDLERAIETFEEVYGRDVSYRGVSEKLRDLQSQRASK